MTFSSLGLSEPLLRSIDKQGYKTPTPIQVQAIPAVLAGKDILAAAQTGTGKTAGFTLPLLQLLDESKPVKQGAVRALIITPTRELAAQIADSVLTYGSYLSLRSTVVFGGVGIEPQKKKLRRGVEILTATPGRLLDLHNQRCVDLSKVEILVLDEADRMLDMGFIHDIRKILNLLPKKRQNLLFSATFSTEIRQMSKGLLNSPVYIEVAPRNSTADNIRQVVHPVDKPRKSKLLCQLIHEGQWGQVLVFTRTKSGANRLTRTLEKDGISAAAIHSNKSQGARTRALADFKQRKIQALVATDIAARGLDIEQLPQVVNFDLPSVAEDYVHRIGRTGRAGLEGQAVSLVSADEHKSLAGIERLLRRSLTSEIITGFEPDPNLVIEPDVESTRYSRSQRQPQSNRVRNSKIVKSSGKAPQYRRRATPAS
ncbi:DEAD/DEAH box helicase [bacterium]|nr:DEAD/DEAH box helicase [bacterium]